MASDFWAQVYFPSNLLLFYVFVMYACFSGVCDGAVLTILIEKYICEVCGSRETEVKAGVGEWRMTQSTGVDWHFSMNLVEVELDQFY